MRSLTKWSSVVCLGGLLLMTGCNDAPQPTPASTSSETPARPNLARGRLNFVTTNIEEGMALAKQEGKPLLLFFTASWCHFCHEMANETFNNTQVVNLSQNFVCVLVDADAQPNLCQQFQVKGFPTVQFVSPRGVPLNKLVGKRMVPDMLQQMQSALQAIAAAAVHPDLQRL